MEIRGVVAKCGKFPPLLFDVIATKKSMQGDKAWTGRYEVKLSHIGTNAVVDELAHIEPLHRSKRLEDTVWHLYLEKKSVQSAWTVGHCSGAK